MEMRPAGIPASRGQGRQQHGSGRAAARPGDLPADNPQSVGRSGTISPATGPAMDNGSGGGPLRAMSPGVVDYLFRQLVSGRPAEDVAWQREGISLSAQPEGAELARRLAETDLDALTPTELFHYVRAAQRLASWAEGLRQSAVGRYCHAGADAPRPGRHGI
ncbi:MAG TPA: hypothetical protein VJQ80_07995 [Arthrobacter sp.]|nr:hypothetical protein [Arthrobacter sp.]